MFKKSVSLVLVALLALSSLAFAQSATVTDMFGREVAIPENVTRVVALDAADCEILCALGCEEMLVGRGEYCDYPESILEVPVVNSGSETNLEQILALAPQVVIMSGMAQTAEQVEALENAGITVVESYASNLADTYTSILMLGAVVDKEAEAEALVAEMQTTFDDIASQCENVGKTVYFEVSPLEWGLWTAGANTFMDEIASLCGLTNAFADVEGWGEISEEQVLERDPDYIFTISMYYGEGPTPEEEIIGRAGWDSITAVKNGNVFTVDSDSMSRPGPRLMDAAKELFADLNR